MYLNNPSYKILNNYKNKVTITEIDITIISTLLKEDSGATIKDISKKTGLSYTTVRYSINKLLKLGIILKEDGYPYTYKANKFLTVVVNPNTCLYILNKVLLFMYYPTIYIYDPTSNLGYPYVLPLSDTNEDIISPLKDIKKDLDFIFDKK